ncbi:Exodeoxyribonuclease I [Rubrivivax sp. A210]|uniref:exodeoxyribonuclease I n=1 Tax=Rubrivivax sp. A210 TaxID=2772301 RepID=UPI0019182C4B|nr:exodeoxyribonuclease I [Rubrivivax sp. A210]CAD5372430.1 Exodeoxyribonuclease I [Rubrivivax sp. A210]
MAETTFFWHDYETFGRVPRRDRPAQFAGVRTDMDLNEVGEPLMIHCRPVPDFLPDPESVLLTGILPQHALQQGLPEHAFAAAVEQALGQDGTIGVGYNSIRFDDEVTRFLFWRNLIDPYAREWQNGCGRWDLLDVVRCTWSLRPEGIAWPRHEAGEMAGRPSFRLEQLTAANGLAHEAAHDALSDVRATLALARLIKSRQPRLWDFCLGLRRKDAVMAEIGVARPFLHLSGMYPVERGCLAVVWPLAPHPVNKNELIVWDLAHDPAELAGLDAATLRRRIFTRQAELPEGEQRLPIKTIHINKSPIVIGNLRTLGAAAERWQIDLAAAQRHATGAAAVARVMQPLWPAVYAREAEAGTPDVDEDLYGGFVGNEDRRTLQRLRELAPDQLVARRPAFHDGRLEELLFRYRARNFNELLDEADRQRWQQHCTERLHGGAGGATTLAAFFERIDALAETADERGQALLEALYDYAEGIAPEAS